MATTPRKIAAGQLHSSRDTTAAKANRKISTMKTKKKKKQKTKRLQIELSGIPRISDRREITIEDVDNIQGTLNAISSRIDDIWDYLQREHEHQRAKRKHK